MPPNQKDEILDNSTDRGWLLAYSLKVLLYLIIQSIWTLKDLQRKMLIIYSISLNLNSTIVTVDVYNLTSNESNTETQSSNHDS